ncbi:MAG: DNA-protecting protein DprA [Candidatus Taylorbacteria bacterium]|nr:DNA-protecting protein DprA [Candidatus Taylorbacteria bacterium]
MNSIRTLAPEDFPPLLREMPSPPKKLYMIGSFPSAENMLLTVVGSRRHSDYGKEAVESLLSGLSGLPVVIVSGLAFGIDSIAHRTALRYGLKTVAVPGSGLSEESIYPAANRELAKEIVRAGGCLVSPFEEGVKAAPWTFPARNRIMAGISHATLVVEADIKSGTLITSKYATEFNRNVFTVPGSIFSSQSAGPHMLIRLGATPLTCAADLAEALGFKPGAERSETDYSDLSADEIKVIEVLSSPLSRDDLLDRLDMETSKISSLISLLEIKGLIEERLGEFRRI